MSAEERVQQLEAAIKDVLAQDMDHICWMDVYTKLAGLVGVKFDPALLPRWLFLHNCQRFSDFIYEGVPYGPCKMSEEMERLRKSRDLHFKASVRAIKMWRERTGQELVWPDYADLTCWLLHKIDSLDPKPGQEYAIKVDTLGSTLVRVIDVDDESVTIESAGWGQKMKVHRQVWKRLMEDSYKDYERLMGEED